MKRILLTVAYDGTNYHGWQIQPNAVTIEQKLNEALKDLTNEEIAVIGASRTDAGVHALCNAAVFDTESRIDPKQFAKAINARLPEDIRVTESCETDPDFHPRKCESRKTYEYRIYTGKIDNPIGRDYALHVYVPLDEAKMKKALSYIVGEHDFKSFCATQAQIRSTVRIIYEASLRREEEYLIFSFTGNGFLMNMIRILVGTLLEIGRGNLEPEDMGRILSACDRTQAGPTAPPHGLCLVGYEFEY